MAAAAWLAAAAATSVPVDSGDSGEEVSQACVVAPAAPPESPPPPPADSGVFAAEVEERLAALLRPSSPVDCVAFGAQLTSAERRYVHQTAQRAGLLSASSGEGSERHVVVYRPDAAGAPAPGSFADAASSSQAPLREGRLSRNLSSLLRHRAVAEGLAIGEDGYAKVSDILLLPVFKAAGNTAEEVEELVKYKDDKKRFQISVRGEETWIRASQGHTMSLIKDSKLLVPILDPAEVPCCVHGTYSSAWGTILRTGGLSRMGRNHIHFAPEPPGGGRVVSGVRADAEVAVFVSVARCLRAGLKLYRSANGVLLTPGDDRGMVPVEHFEHAVRISDGAVLWPSYAATVLPPPRRSVEPSLPRQGAESAPVQADAAAAERLLKRLLDDGPVGPSDARSESDEEIVLVRTPLLAEVIAA